MSANYDNWNKRIQQDGLALEYLLLHLHSNPLDPIGKNLYQFCIKAVDQNGMALEAIFERSYMFDSWWHDEKKVDRLLMTAVKTTPAAVQFIPYDYSIRYAQEAIRQDPKLWMYAPPGMLLKDEDVIAGLTPDNVIFVTRAMALKLLQSGLITDNVLKLRLALRIAGLRDFIEFGLAGAIVTAFITLIVGLL